MLPKWIWHPNLVDASSFTLTQRFTLTSDEKDLCLHIALTGEAEIVLDGQTVVGVLPEHPANMTRFSRFKLPSEQLQAGEHSLILRICCTKPMPVAPISIHLSSRLVGCIAFLQGQSVYVPTDSSWKADGTSVREVCLYGEEPYGDLEDAPEWFVEGGFGDITAAAIPDVSVIDSSALKWHLVDGGEIGLTGAFTREIAVEPPSVTNRNIFYHLRKQKEWGELRQTTRQIGLADIPYAIIDLKREFNARFHLVNNGSSDAVVLWHAAESQQELMHYDHCITECVRVEAGGRRVILPQGMRYTQFYFIGKVGKPFSMKLHFEDVSARIEQIGTIESDSDLLTKIYETAVHTNRICHQIGLWDGVKRDRLNWSYDFYLAAKADYFLWSDLAVLKRSMLELGGGTPYGYWLNSIPAYTLWWLNNVWEYFFYTADREFVITLKDDLHKHIRWVLANLDPETGLMQEGIVSLIEWVPMKETEQRVCLHALLHMTSESLKKLDAYVPELELPMEWPLPAVSETDYLAADNLITKMFGIKSGLVSDTAARRLLEEVRLVEPVTPLSAYWLAECLSEYGLQEKAWQVVATVWGGMLEEGATTFWESVRLGKFDDYHDALTTFTHYGSYRISLCHSWSSTPVQWIARFVGGIEPVEPGFAAVRLAPQPFEGLSNCRIQVPTPFGPLSVHWVKSESGGIDTQFTAPASIVVQMVNDERESVPKSGS